MRIATTRSIAISTASGPAGQVLPPGAALWHGGGMRLAAIQTYPIKGCYRLDLDEARVEPWGLAGDRRWMVVDDEGVGVTQRQEPALVTVHPEPRPGGLLLRAAGRAALEVAEPVDGEPAEVRVFAHQPGVPARVADPAANDWLSQALDRKVRLVWLGDPAARPIPDVHGVAPDDRVSFADGYPLLLANRASLDALNEWLVAAGSPEGPLPMTRFRPNLVVGGAAPWAEDDWLGRRLRIGPVVFRVAKPCGRCVVTTTDQETGVRGHEPLRTLARHRNRNRQLLFGQNLVPLLGPAGTGATVRVGDPVDLLPD